MGDLTSVASTIPARIGGVSSTSGLPDNFADVNSGGSLQVAGQGVAGTPAGGVVSIQGVASGTAVPVSQTSGPWTQNLTQVGGSAIALGQTTMSASVPVTIASNQSALAVSQSGTWTTGRTWTLVSGTDSVSAVQSGTWNIGTVTSITNAVAVTQSTSPWVTKDQSDGPVTPGTVASFSQLAGGQYNSTLPTLTNTQQSAIQLDSSGRLIISPLTSASTVAATQSGTWTVQPGNTPNTTPWLVTVSTALPAGTNIIGALSANQSVNLTEVGGSAIALGQTTMSASVPVTIASNQSALAVSQSGTWTVQQGTPPWTIQGDSASGATASGNPVQIGGVFNTTQPTVTSGQTSRAQTTSRGALIVATGVDTFTASAVQSGTWTVQPGNTANTTPWAQNLTEVGGSAVSLGQEVMTSSIPVTLASDQTGINTFLDKTGTSTITAVDEAATITVNGMSTLTFNVTGTWVGSFEIEATIDTVNWFLISVNRADDVNVVSFDGFAANLSAMVACGGFAQVRIISTTWTSGTATITWNVGAGLNTSQIPLAVAVTDISGTGTITALNGAVAVTTQGRGNVTFNITGTWVATLTAEATVDDVNWFIIDGLIANGTDVTTITANTQWILNCGGYFQVRLIATAYTSGTADIAYDVGAGANIVGVYNPTASALNAQVVGNVASGTADSGNGVKIAALANSNIASLPTVADNDRVDAQADLQGRIYVTNAPTDGAKPTYSATSAISFASAASATDIFTITGSATKTIRVIRFGFTADQTTAGTVNVSLVKRSSANSGGTSAASTAVPNDSSSAAATATVLSYTANPTSLGATVGTVRSAKTYISTAATANDSFVNEWYFGEMAGQAIVLRGTAQVLAVNLGATTVSGGAWTCYWEWSEE